MTPWRDLLRWLTYAIIGATSEDVAALRGRSVPVAVL